MKKTISNLTQATLLGAALISQQQAMLAEDIKPQKTNLSVSVIPELQSQYFFRGLRYSNKNEPVIWQTIAGTAEFPNKSTATLSYFGNYNLGTKKYDETDILACINKPFGPFTVTLGSGFYHSPTDSWRDTAEFTGGLLFNHEKMPFAVSISGGYDFIDAKAGFMEAGLSKSIPLSKSPNAASLDLSATTGFNFHYFTKQDGLAYTDLKAALNIPLTKSLSIKPSIMKQFSHREDIESPLIAILSFCYTFK